MATEKSRYSNLEAAGQVRALNVVVEKFVCIFRSRGWVVMIFSPRGCWSSKCPQCGGGEVCMYFQI
jgi:hypothetical protein